MLKNRYKVLGVMSGTSLDGLDIAECIFEFNGQWQFHIEHAETMAYPHHWLHKLKDLSNLDERELIAVDKQYTSYLAHQINSFITKYDIQGIDFISSHGHTAKHLPSIKLTYQIGNMPEISQLTNYKVVCDFRVQDVALGGQGAPLVPIGDKFLFKDYDYCLNLGGFSNVSYAYKDQRLAFDISPVNTILNYYALQRGLEFDMNGEMSSKGKIDFDLLKQLNALDYYSQEWPKSLGVEWVNHEFIPKVDSFDISTEDILRTLTEHISIQISKVINPSSSVLVTGGGAYNSFLINRLKKNSEAEFIIPNTKIVEFKEALIFGFLGVLKLRKEINCLSSVTGASRDHSSGKIYEPKILIS